MSNVMLDLETASTSSNAIIVSIGAVVFDVESGTLGEEFYEVVDWNSCRDHGLQSCQSTLVWWYKQAPEVQQVLDHAVLGAESLPDVLKKFQHFLSENGNNPKVWGNGSDFDNVILANAYRAAGITLPWKYRNSKCYRTLKSLVKGPKIQRSGIHHNALDDAKSQAQHAIELLQLINLKLGQYQ